MRNLSKLLLLLVFLIGSSMSVSAGTTNNGWVDTGGKRYFYQNQQVVKGWLYYENNWYYFDPNTGAMKTGWVFYKENWYYLKSDGAMKVGWLYENGKWYYLTKSGAMKMGWLLDEGKWYYLNSTGAMHKGWLKYKDKWYFLANNGAMLTGWVTLEKRYYLNKSGVWIPNTIADGFKTVGDNQQLILVTSAGYGTNRATIRTFQKSDGKWYQGMSIPGYIGKLGFADVMSEGGQKSPRGKYTIGTAFGRYDNPGTKLPYRKITSDDVWVDDPKSSLYNTWQKASQNNGQWNSAEKMNVLAYNYGFVINYNTVERTPGAGSAIFFHVGSSYTLGCTAVSQANVVSIIKWLNPERKPVIIQSPEAELSKY
ncbi:MULTISPECIES: L,D-transpeptidase family protein [unclassified Bacillus (in: firmicutes)]|uniref:L,D-transpeptidase family protein n=1 Tax=unclassified Bacillus (in: firmicutes) TaxID=185979 RepID=UPI0008EFE5D7|nr:MULTISPECIES: L,D-transpeptidase family protein [unclassified Bacillus (in: firmicutes)]SFB04348.1 L,D-peptidoglycan transpeptidase YkuD, ErfK/YbiS/YcfS/YnhG family [Bacillus sp. UNCCL13]SFQ88516.1 L,D-peptidoglycan transpeptidase YkuD, ErfK/YbiS/YcfS/YnhG family [Bacillus sp. cl95]